MGTFKATVADIKRSGTKVGQAADHVENVPLEAPLNKIKHALPGTASASSAGTLQSQWRRDKKHWVQAARNYDTSLQTYASNVERTDVDAAGQVEAVANATQGITRNDWKAS